jgi:lipopolysaccharide export system protein LptA
VKKLLLLTIILNTLLFAQELKITADSFKADEEKGVSVFKGNVQIHKKNDDLNASVVTIYTDKKRKPTKFVAVGNVSFIVETKESAVYSGSAGKVIYLPNKKEYYFYDNVHLKQLNEKKEIQGDEVILNTNDGKAYAKGLKKKPVIMIFDIADEE